MTTSRPQAEHAPSGLDLDIRQLGVHGAEVILEDAGQLFGGDAHAVDAAAPQDARVLQWPVVVACEPRVGDGVRRLHDTGEPVGAQRLRHARVREHWQHGAGHRLDHGRRVNARQV